MNTTDTNNIRYNEGFGTLYERMVRKEYLLSFKNNFNPGSILEVKCGIGIDSSIFDNATLVDNRAEYLTDCKEICPSSHIVDADYMKLPFRSNSFDLVWSSCLLDDAVSGHDLNDYISELKRVSKRHLLLFVSNDLHPTHGIPKLLSGKPWVDIRTMPSIVKKCGLDIIEQGNIDSPPWPSGLCLPSHNKSDSRKLESPLLKKLVNIEVKYTPGVVKKILGHQVFVLAEKKDG